VLVICAVQPATQQSPIRGIPLPRPSGSAIVSGIVTTADAQAVPVRRARVTLRPEGAAEGWSVTTEDDGRFEIVNVPAGRFTVSAAKPAWLTSSYGAARPGRPGTPFPVREGDRVSDITIRMSPGGVLSGTVIDRTGQPIAGVSVSAMRYTPSVLTGERVPSRPEGAADSVTDDAGGFRCYGLLPGEYVLVATLRIGPPAALMDLRPLSTADVQRALTGSADASPSRLVGYAPVYFPGVVAAAQATRVSVAAAEEHAGLTIRFDPVPTARVDVPITLPESANPASLMLVFTGSQGGSGRDTAGRVAYTGVPPGTYSLMAAAAETGAPLIPGNGRGGRGSGPALSLFAMADVTVDGRDITVPLTLQPGVPVSGTARFEGEPSRWPRERGSLQLLPVREASLSTGTAPIDESGTFAFKSIPPGKYRLEQQTKATAPWELTSAMWRGRDVFDTLLEIRGNEPVNDLQLTFSDQVSELAGRLETAAGAPAASYDLVVFSADRASWMPLSRRVRSMRPATDGTFSVRGLPAGDYFIAALADVEPGEWYDSKFLSSIVAASVKVTVRDGARTEQNLRIK